MKIFNQSIRLLHSPKSHRMMRLLECNSGGEFSLTEDIIGDDEIPPYAILSHTWKEGEEVAFQELIDGTGKGKSGYEKMRFCGEQAERDGLQYFWVDICCINKSNNTELSEAANSMYRWYRSATRCYVFLSDVSGLAFDANDKLCELPFESASRQADGSLEAGRSKSFLPRVRSNYSPEEVIDSVISSLCGERFTK